MPFKSPEMILLSSRQATTINSTGNRATFKLINPISIPNNIHGYISLSSFRYSNVFYSVPNLKNEFSYRLSSDFYGTDYSVIIEAGNYGIDALVAKLNTELGGHGFTFAYNPLTFKVEISNNLWGFQITNGSMNSLLGVLETGTGLITYTGSYAINLSGINVLEVQVPNLGLHSNGVSSSSSSIVASIMNSVQSGYTMTYNSANPIQYKLTSPVITDIEIVLTGDGDDLNFLGSNWTLQLNIIFIYKPVVQSEAITLETLANKNIPTDSSL